MKQKSKTTMIKQFSCRYYQLDALAAYLEEQAAAGWELMSKEGSLLEFRKCEPKSVKICVEPIVLHDADLTQHDFHQRWKPAGWKSICNDGTVHIFENEDMQAEFPSMHTQSKLEWIHRKSLWGTVIDPAIGAVFLIGLWLLSQPGFVWNLSSFEQLTMEIGLLFCIGILLFSIADYLLWYRKAKIQVVKNEPFSYRKRKYFNLLNVELNLYLTLFWMGIILHYLYSRDSRFLIAALFGFGIVLLLALLYYLRISKNKKVTEGNGFGFFLGIGILFFCCVAGVISTDFATDQNSISRPDAKDKIPVTLEDLNIATSGKTDREWEYSGTPWLEQVTYWDDSVNKEEATLYYTVYATKYAGIYDKLVKQEYLEADYYTFKEIKDDAFDAEKVYYDEEQNTWLLLYDNRIVELCEPQSLNDTQKTIFVQKLNDISA